ncbi:MAG: biotin--[Anaerolineaceae bacterium]|nr:biotin--[acetyl-CoA-carboxylase] ligase [Anaerolineaceae bacterium]
MEKLSQETLEKALMGLPIGDLYYFDSIGSTNDYGFERAAAGAPDMTVITAFAQTSGRGRMQRKWITVPGTSLPMTVIIRPGAAEMEHLNLFSPLTGLALHEALRDCRGIESEIKWPNDVLLNRKKISGILCETQWEGSKLNALILGVGTNLYHGSAPDISDITYPASSIEDETGIIIPQTEWIRCFLSKIIEIRPLLGRQEFFSRWEGSLAYKGEKTRVVHPDGSSELCTVTGISPDGSLITVSQTGEQKTWLAGEISLRSC